jgi:WbqC-like protein family
VKLALMQPYFFPYLGYFQLIAAVDRFVLFDDAQYMKGGWINRNRVLKPQGGPQYITMPVAKHGSRDPITTVRSKPGYAWKAFVLRQVEHYKKKAPFYSQVRDLLTTCFELDEQSVVALNAHYLSTVCKYINVEFNIETLSSMGVDYSRISEADDWTLTLSEHLKASEFVNPIGGAQLFSKNKFDRLNIKLSFLRQEFRPYDQGREPFVAGLSIVDVLMFNDPKTVRDMLDQCELVGCGDV